MNLLLSVTTTCYGFHGPGKLIMFNIHMNLINSSNNYAIHPRTKYHHS
jgi:hypothetical protein